MFDYKKFEEAKKVLTELGVPFQVIIPEDVDAAVRDRAEGESEKFINRVVWNVWEALEFEDVFSNPYPEEAFIALVEREIEDMHRMGKWETCDRCNLYDDVTKEDTFMKMYEGLPICELCAEKEGIPCRDLEEIGA